MDTNKKHIMELTPGQLMLLELFPHHDAKVLAEYLQDVVAKSTFFVEKEDINQYGSYLVSNLATIVFTMAIEYEATKKKN